MVVGSAFVFTRMLFSFVLLGFFFVAIKPSADDVGGLIKSLIKTIDKLVLLVCDLVLPLNLVDLFKFVVELVHELVLGLDELFLPVAAGLLLQGEHLVHFGDKVLPVPDKSRGIIAIHEVRRFNIVLLHDCE